MFEISNKDIDEMQSILSLNENVCPFVNILITMIIKRLLVGRMARENHLPHDLTSFS